MCHVASHHITYHIRKSDKSEALRELEREKQRMIGFHADEAEDGGGYDLAVYRDDSFGEHESKSQPQSHAFPMLSCLNKVRDLLQAAWGVWEGRRSGRLL